MLTWTNPISAQMTTEGSGAIQVPIINPGAWALQKMGEGRNKYICANVQGGYAELEIASSTVGAPYGQSKVAANETIPGLVGNSAYIRLRAFGQAEAKDSVDLPGLVEGLAPVSVSVNVTVPSGVTVTTQQMQELAGAAISALSTVDGEGIVVPFSNVPEVALGAVNLAR
jgi:hypothetical protein